MASDELSSHGRLGFPRQDDAAQEAFDDPQTQPALHPVWPVIGACAPAEVPSQTCNTALYARTPAIARSPNARPLQGLSFDFIEDHVSAKLDQTTSFVTRNGAGVRLK